MIKFWSETPTARTREIVADIATWVWVAFWIAAGSRINDTIGSYSAAGRTLQEGGEAITGVGQDLGSALGAAPLVGEGLGDLAEGAFAGAGLPFIAVGGQLESLIILLARLVTLLLLAVVLVPWLTRYLPWRARRLQTVRAADRAIRKPPRAIQPAATERILATRALYRLDYPDLLEHTPDPLGDFDAGRFDRLARAELASVGLRPSG